MFLKVNNALNLLAGSWLTLIVQETLGVINVGIWIYFLPAFIIVSIISVVTIVAFSLFCFDVVTRINKKE